MDVAVIVAIIGGINGVAVAIVGGIFSYFNHRAEKKAAENRASDLEYRKKREESEQKREERDACIYDLVFATATGTEVLLHQAHGDKVNGNVDEAMSSIHAAKSECNRVFNKHAASM